MKKFLFLLAALAAASYGAVCIEGKKANAEIILGPRPSCAAQFAALELQYHLKLIGGAAVPIAAAPGSAQVKIYLGRSAEKYASQEYEISVKGNTIELSGKDAPRFHRVDYKRPGTFPGYWEEQGTLYAVYDFLEMLGVRWYLPTEMGITYTPRSKVEIPDTHIRRRPTFIYRDTMALNMPKDLCGDTVGNRAEAIKNLLNYRDRELWHRRCRHGGKEIIFCHSLYRFYPRFHKTHKQWFARGQTPAWDMQLCYTHPEVIARVVQDARDFFDGKIADTSSIISGVPKNYRSNTYPMGAMDNRRWCKCARCQALLRKDGNDPDDHFSKGNISEYWYTFVAAVARELKKSHPDCFVATHSYSGYTMPPRHVRLPANVIVRPIFNVTAVFQPELYAENARILKAWKRYAPETSKYVAVWFCHPNFDAKCSKTRYFPHFIAGHVKKYFKDFLEYGAVGMGWEPSYAVVGAAPAFDMVDGYINWKLAWNKDLDADQLYNEFFTGFYGPAARPMKAFYQFAEKIYSDPANYPPHAADDLERSWLYVGSTQRMARLQKFVDEAEKAAVRDPYRQRVRWFKNGLWRYMRRGKEAADKLRAGLMSELKNNLIPGGDFNAVPPGNTPSGFSAHCKISPGGLQGNALQLSCKFRQGKQFRTASNLLRLSSLAPGRYRISGFLKGNYDSVLVKLSSGKRTLVRLHLAKNKLLSAQGQWRIFQQEFSLSETTRNNELLLVIYGPENGQLLLDNLALLPIRK